jgi:hypothetical protein
MFAQVTLIPSESKKLIAKAVVKTKIVKEAIKNGLVIIHPSSSTYFILKEIIGREVFTNRWVCGMIVPKGTCVEMGMFLGEGAEQIISTDPEKLEESPGKGNPGAFMHSWILRKGELSSKKHLKDILEEMGPNDVFIKGANALDTEGNVGILWANSSEGGTAGLVMRAQRRIGFNTIFAVGLEKLVPFPIEKIVKEAKRFKYDYSMGLPVGILPVNGTVITELKAIEILSGAIATPIAAGGLAGAEGSTILVIKGDKKQVVKALKIIKESKGARLPQVRIPICADCPQAPDCGLPNMDLNI